MPWSTSRLFSSSRGLTSQEKANERWHRDVQRRNDVVEFLRTGYPSVESLRIDSLNRATVDLLRVWENGHLPPSTQRDGMLADFLHEHATKFSASRDVATFASLGAFSYPAATRQLCTLMDLEIDRYLRCIVISGHFHEYVVSREEFQSALCLLRIRSGKGHDTQELQGLVRFLRTASAHILIPPQIIHGALANSGIKERIEVQLQFYLNQKQYWSAYQMVSWLQQLSIPERDNDIIAVLQHFPSSSWLLAWRPNTKRIDRWEHSSYSESQRMKLSPIFELDGPDLVTQQLGSLKLAEPWCYDHLYVHDKSSQTLETLLDLLYRASMVGPNTVDLFIYLCVNHEASESDIALLDECIKKNNELCSTGFFNVRRALEPQPDWRIQVDCLTDALTYFTGSTTTPPFYVPIHQFSDCIVMVTEKAKSAFYEQLDKRLSTAGMLLHKLGTAIIHTSCIHDTLPPDLLTQFKSFPSAEDLETIFSLLQASMDHQSKRDTCLRKFLTSTLGGRLEAESTLIDPRAIQEELRFWRRPPDAYRKEFARSLGKIQCMEYTLYTSCLTTMLAEDDLFVSEMGSLLIIRDRGQCLKFVEYLMQRRGLNQLQSRTWLLLLDCLVREQGSMCLRDLAGARSREEGLLFMNSLLTLIAPITIRVPESEVGLTEEQLRWWEKVAGHMGSL